jgi:ammonium transporter, Amt family
MMSWAPPLTADSLAYWEWNPSGWLYQLGALDFAGSGPVHIASGFGALAWAFMLGKRHDPLNESHNPRIPHFRGHNPFLVGIGTIFIWFGWLAFNGASTANLSIRSIYAVMNTNLAACGGGVAWASLEYLHGRKFSIIGFCSGIISGLVGITAAAGFVPIYTSTLIGFLTSVACFYTNRYKYLISIDEGLDIWAIHGVGGVVGDVMTGFFAANWVTALDGVTTTNPGGWYSRNWIQMGYQLAAALTCAAWSFFVSCLLLFVINKIPGLHLRATEEEELQGLDQKYFSDYDMDTYGMGQYGAAIDAERGSGTTGVAPGVVTTTPSASQDGQKLD